MQSGEDHGRQPLEIVAAVAVVVQRLALSWVALADAPRWSEEAGATVGPVNYVAVAVAVIAASAVVAVLGFVFSLVRSRQRRLVVTGPDMPTDWGLVLLMIGSAGLLSGIGVVVFLLLTT